MARVLSGVVMIAIVVGATWWLSVEGIFVLAGIVLVIAGIEYCRLTFILSNRLLTLLVRLLISCEGGDVDRGGNGYNGCNRFYCVDSSIFTAR